MANFSSYNITRAVVPNSIRIANNTLNRTFSGLRYLTTVELNHPNVTNMYYTFD